MAARGATIGKTAYVTPEFAGFNINANLLRLKPNPKKLDGRYFWYFIKSPLGQSQFRALVTSTAKETITVPKLKTISIPLPSLRDQRRIVDYLDGLQEEVNSLKALQAQTAAELDALLPSILDKAFKGEL
jgi:type I restriction enzyme S subunit